MSRIHGFVRPFHPLQFMSWWLFGMFGLFYSLIWIPGLHGYFTEFYPSATSTGITFLLSAIYYILTFFVIYTTARATWCDPRDPALFSLPRYEDVHERELRRTQVIHGSHWCPYCHQHVNLSSKHCRVCDKCVNGFDHHCKWLNNCVGQSNYRLFLGCITSVTLFLAYQLCLGLTLFIHSFTTPYYIMSTMNTWYPSITLACFQALIGIVLCLQFPTLLSIIQLLALHIWLIYHNITTYTWIMNNRKKLNQKIKKNQIVPEDKKASELEMIAIHQEKPKEQPVIPELSPKIEESQQTSNNRDMSHLLVQGARSSVDWGHAHDMMDASSVMANAGVMTLQRLPSHRTLSDMEMNVPPSFAGAESIVQPSHHTTILPPISTHRKEWSPTHSHPTSHHEDDEDMDRVETPRARHEPLHDKQSTTTTTTTHHVHVPSITKTHPYAHGIERSHAQTHHDSHDLTSMITSENRSHHPHDRSSLSHPITSDITTQHLRHGLRSSVTGISHAPHLITSETHSTYHMHHRDVSQSYLDSYVDRGIRDETHDTIANTQIHATSSPSIVPLIQEGQTTHH